MTINIDSPTKNDFLAYVVDYAHKKWRMIDLLRCYPKANAVFFERYGIWYCPHKDELYISENVYYLNNIIPDIKNKKIKLNEIAPLKSRVCPHDKHKKRQKFYILNASHIPRVSKARVEEWQQELENG